MDPAYASPWIFYADVISALKAIFQIQGENKGWALAVDKEKGS